MEIRKVHTNREIDIPDDYHCDCDFCKKFLGLIINEDGSKYNKHERRKYYHPEEKAHIAKTPLHVARWLVQEYSEPGDWVLDPTMGAGTTAVEALRQGRKVAGVELEFFDVVEKNVSINNPDNLETKLFEGDARNLRDFFGKDFQVDLVINNPPYSGDESQSAFGKGTNRLYRKDLPNLGNLKENADYWDALQGIYQQATDLLRPGGFFGIGVKDMVRGKKPFLLHFMYSNLIMSLGEYDYIGMALLPHYPTTLFMNTYNKRFPDVPVPAYQTINVFRKRG